MGISTTWKKVLAALSAEELAFLEQHSATVRFEAKEMLFKQGSFAVNCYIIQEGFCKLTYASGAKKRIVQVSKPGDIIGKDYEHLDYYPYSVYTMTPSKMIVIPMQTMVALCEQNKEVQLLLSLYFRKIYTRVIAWVLNLQFKNIEGAVAMFVLKYCVEDYKTVLLTREEISDFVGYSRESVIHTLKRFEKDGLISIQKKNISILEEAKLRDLVKFG